MRRRLRALRERYYCWRGWHEWFIHGGINDGARLGLVTGEIKCFHCGVEMPAELRA